MPESSVTISGIRTVVLANWLSHHGLSTKYYISEKIYLWTTPFLTEFEAIFKTAPTTPKPALIAALRNDLEREAIDFVQFVPSVKKFFAQDVPLSTSTNRDGISA